MVRFRESDCLAENHYARFAELARARGVRIHPEAGGPCWPKVVPMDALKNLGRCDIPMGEFWQSSHWHEGINRNTNGKQTSTAAHIYGKRWVMAEAFTSMEPHWEEGPAELKPTAGNSPRFSDAVELQNAWTVRFASQWGGPESVRFEKLDDWTKADSDGIKYYSGTATYVSEKFALPASLVRKLSRPIFLDLGEVKNVARVRLNGKDLGVLWTRPFRVEITGAVQPADNLLEIVVTNLWPNRLIGDAALPSEKRFTRTHVTKFTKDTPLLPSGLLGPVRLMAEE